MKSKVHVLELIIFAFSIGQCENEKEEPEVIINDNNFLNALIELGIDKDNKLLKQ